MRAELMTPFVNFIQAEGEIEVEVGATEQNESEARKTERNTPLTDADLDDYMKTGKTKHTRDKKMNMLASGNSPILTTPAAVKKFIAMCIHGKALGQAKAFGKVGQRLAKAIASVRSDVDVYDSYLEINSDSLREAYKRHSAAKEKGDMPLTETDFQSIPELLDDFDGVTSVDSYNGKTEAHIYKRTTDGYIRLITVVSSERNSLQVTKMVGVSQEKFENKYGKKIERDSANRRGQTELTDASNPSTTATSAESLSGNSIPRDSEKVNRKTKKISIDPTWTNEKGRKRTYGEKLTEKKVHYDHYEMDLGEAINLYLVTKRAHAEGGRTEYV